MIFNEHSSLEVLGGERQLYALVSDFLRADLQGRQSLNLLRNAIQAGIPARIYGAIGKDSGAQNVTLAACRKLLMDSYGVSEEGAGQFVNSFATALGWKVVIENPVPVEAPKKSPKSSATKKSAPHKTPTSKAKPASPKAVQTSTPKQVASAPPPSIPDAMELLRRKAEQGDAIAQLKMGNHFYDKRDYENAARWFRLSAEQGNTVAQYSLGRLCEDGLGVKFDGTEAARLFGLAAEKGMPEAQYSLGLMYEMGYLPFDKDRKKAKEWYQLAADQGHNLAKKGLERLARWRWF